ncbi:hypothetical protein BKA56DRAFT_674327 [Ilyonectria sp. MPI-CAGE-AT-0026]|nr:hypothetical protein BKA56DRAFT_674327 [Ilyonectria sp. MPI-CAGE-AT-0026]
MAAGLKKVPKSVLVFGASGRVGSQVIHALQQEQPDIRMRLVTTSESKKPELEKAWQSSEVVIADFFNEPSLHDVVKDMEGVFVVTPGSVNGQTAMTNLVKALKESGNKLIHVIRITAMFPDLNPRRIPKRLVDPGLGLPIQSPIAKRFSKKAFFRAVPYMDIADIGEAAARLLLSPDERHIGLFHNINNGTDLLRIEDVAQVMGRVWQVEVTADTSKEGFLNEYTGISKERREYLWEFFKFEKCNEVCWSLNDFAERILGRKPKTLVQWLIGNKSDMLE